MLTQMMNAAGKPALQLGRGVDSTTGSALGVAIAPDDPKIDPNNSGQHVNYNVSIIESSDELSSALGLSAGAEMRYGLFSAEGTVDLQEKSEFKSFATYVLATCDVLNPPVGLFNPSPQKAAQDLKDNPQSFRRGFGDTFVRSVITGGQFYALLEIVHKESLVQKSLATSIEGKYNGFLTDAQVDVKFTDDEQKQMAESQFRILQYQASGQGVETSLVRDTEAVIGRLKEFPQTVLQHPVAIQVELASYDTIPELQPNLIRQQALEDALEDCARKRLYYKSVMNDCAFYLEGTNSQFFQSPTSADIVQNWSRAYTDACNAVTKHAISISDGSVDESHLMFDPPTNLPAASFTRVPSTQADVVSVPSVLGLGIDEAQARIRQVGLLPIPSPVDMSPQDPGSDRIVLSQNPKDGSVQKNTGITLVYAQKKSQINLNLDLQHQGEVSKKRLIVGKM